MAASFQPPSHLFERNISLNDLDLALNVREIVRKDVVIPEEATKHRHLGSSTSCSFVLPSLQNLHEEFRKFVFSFLVDGHILRELETARRLNWCISLCRMVTVNTLGDGNCLMHAASIGMWAVNDRYQTLRKTVYEALVEDVEGTRFYHSRWKSEEQRQILLNQIGGYERTEEQWAHEWEEVIRHISQNEFPYGPNGAQFGSLEEIHIFVLANILRRTVIVVSDETLRGQFGDSYAPINFGGIYLPLLWDSVDCVKSPLVIGYADGHFTAVVSIEDGKLDLGLESQSAPPPASCVHAVPLVKCDGTPLPVHFLYDDEAPLASDRLRQYLDCAKVPIASNPGEPRSHILVAKLHFAEQPPCMKDLVEGYFAKAREEYQRVSRNRQLSPQLQPGTQLPALQIVQCQTQGCDFFGSTETGNRCSKCLNEYLRSLAPACEPNPSGQQQQNPPYASASSSSMNLPLAKSVQCSTTGCKYGAVANRGGLCERCFEAERSAAELAASMNHTSLASSKRCANHTNGCEFFGLPQHHDLCSRCYRSFCLRMENTLGVSSPTGLPPTSPTATTANLCQTPGCRHPGVPALYGMCVQCYSGCIHSFITSEGRSVGSVKQVSLHLPSPPPPPPPPPPPSPAASGTKKTPLPTGAGKKGVLCASPGCLNEGVFHLGDLCAECFERKSGPSPQMRTNLVPVPVPGTTAAAGNFPVTQPPLNTVSASAAVVPTYHLTSALTNAIGICSNPTCPNKTGKEGKSLCQRCEQWIASMTYLNPTASSLQPCRLVDVVTATSSSAASMPLAQLTPTNTGAYLTPASSSSQQARTSHQVAAATALPNPSSQVPAGPCAMGCGKPSAQDSGLCEQCYVTAFELELKRQTAPQPSRQKGATASSISNNQVEQRNTNVLASTARGLQQTETSATAKKQALMPCTSTGCMQFGALGKNGLCEECFHKKGKSELGATASQGNHQQISSNGHSLYTTRPTEQNRQLVGSSLPATSTLKEPIQVCQSQSPPYRAGGRRRDSNSEDVEENVQGQRCRGTNCTLFGTPETNGYCSRCFLESTIPQSGPSSIPDFPSEVSSLSIPQDRSLPEQCRVTGCDNFAAPERHGHCDDCFRRFYPEVFTQRQMSESSN